MNSVCSSEAGRQPTACANDKKLGRKKEAAIEALLTTWSDEEAARVAGVGQ
jgi:hypothetical protein